MREINLMSVVQAFSNIEQQLYEQYLKSFKITLKNDEVKDLQTLLNELNELNVSFKALNRYFVGFRIPQISKEFDLLRFGDNYNINIELKRLSTEEKITKQLIESKFYLRFLGNQTLLFSYISNTNTLYTLDEENNLVKFSLKELIGILEGQQIKDVDDIYKLFNPTNYLVSPFNSTYDFIEGQYFLTDHQKKIKKDVLNDFENDTASLISICGKAGTGKTLLTYDIAKEYINRGLKVIIIHCGLLNKGHEILIGEYGWKIIPAKFIGNHDYSLYDLIIIDEAQRIRPHQLEIILEQVNSKNRKCIFSFDKQQCLRGEELNNNIDLRLQEISTQLHVLGDKLRTNKEIASFTSGLFNKGKRVSKCTSSTVEINYFQTYEDAVKYMNILNLEGWKIINYTPSVRTPYPYDKLHIDREDNAHIVVGQEFDKVVAVIDSYFYYAGNNLSTRGYQYRPYYHPTNMLYQIISRTRKKLNLVIINNQTIMARCLSIMETID